MNLQFVVLLLIVIGVLFDLLNLYKTLKKRNEILFSGKVISVGATSSYIRAYLDIEILLNESNKKIKISGDFRNTLRWWLQKVPKENDTIYFYLNETKEVKTKLTENNAYGISVNKPCSAFKKSYDLMYYYEFSPPVTFLILLIVVLIQKHFGINSTLIHNCNVYIFVRFFLGCVIL